MSLRTPDFMKATFCVLDVSLIKTQKTQERSSNTETRTWARNAVPSPPTQWIRPRPKFALWLYSELVDSRGHLSGGAGSPVVGLSVYLYSTTFTRFV